MLIKFIARVEGLKEHTVSYGRVFEAELIGVEIIAFVLIDIEFEVSSMILLLTFIER